MTIVIQIEYKIRAFSGKDFCLEKLKSAITDSSEIYSSSKYFCKASEKKPQN